MKTKISTANNKEVTITNKNTEGFRVLGKDKQVSNDTRATGLNNNDLIVGSSGSGKTGGYVIPNILQSKESMVIADTKSLLAKKLSSHLRSEGYDVKVIDFINPHNSTRYNPLDYVGFNSKTGMYNEQDILTIASAMIPNYDMEEMFWTGSARSVIACVIGYVLEVFDECDKNMTSVVAVFKALCSQMEDNSGKGYVKFLEEWKLEYPRSFAVKKYELFKNVVNADKTWNCIQQFVSAELDVFDFNEITEMFTNKDTFKLNQLGNKKIALFLNISDTDRSLDKLVNIFYAQVFQVLFREADKTTEGRLSVPVRIFLDDFATNTYIPNFEKTISVIRSRDIYVSIILQSLTQLETIYTKPQAITIINNCDNIIYLGSNDIGTASYIATRMCRSPEKVLCMPTTMAYIITRGVKGEEVEKTKPYSYQNNC